jgi:hypothetical protein
MSDLLVHSCIKLQTTATAIDYVIAALVVAEWHSSAG